MSVLGEREAPCGNRRRTGVGVHAGERDSAESCFLDASRAGDDAGEVECSIATIELQESVCVGESDCGGGGEGAAVGDFQHATWVAYGVGAAAALGSGDGEGATGDGRRTGVGVCAGERDSAESCFLDASRTGDDAGVGRTESRTCGSGELDAGACVGGDVPGYGGIGDEELSGVFGECDCAGEGDAFEAQVSHGQTRHGGFGEIGGEIAGGGDGGGGGIYGAVDDRAARGSDRGGGESLVPPVEVEGAAVEFEGVGTSTRPELVSGVIALCD